MGFVSVIVAALAAYAFGAFWYMVMAKPWMAAAGLSNEMVNRKNPMPYIISLVSVVIVAGMMRYIFTSGGISTLGNGAISGLGLGLFIAVPWIATNNGFAQRPATLTLIDGTYVTVGCTIIGAVLTLV
jgi:hypothetical protein